MTRLLVTATVLSSAWAQSGTEVPSLTISTVVASPSASSGATLPPQVDVPPKQDWCPSDIFCAGQLLQTVNVANLYIDPKTFVDKPTSQSPSSVASTFSGLNNNAPQNATFQQILDFVDTEFKGEGTELEALPLPEFNANPAFLGNVSDSLVKAFAQTVNGFWTQLIRGTNSSTLCNGVQCESSLIPLNHTFVVPGGRFREQYYWDSFWIVEGLLQSELFDVVNATLQNFMDELDTIGFIPNGGRIYYLNRSQPPLFIQMLHRYVTVTGDRSILDRALPLAEKELTWWLTNRSVNITSPSSGQTHTLYHYSVNNSAPRPESYLTDYVTANGDPTNSSTFTGLNLTQRSALYAELASGAETGWDYTARWVRGLNDRSLNDSFPSSWSLRDLEVRNTVPVDLNSILHRNYVLLSSLYPSNSSRASSHLESASRLQAGILDVFWNSTKLAFYDFNLRTQRQNTIFTAANFYPYWSGIIPEELLRDTSSTQERVQGAFASVRMVMERWNGTFPSSFVDTGLQWDAPNAWPPHQYIILSALRALPTNITSSPPISASNSSSSSFSLVPTDQLGLTESELPGQPLAPNQNSSTSGSAADINFVKGPTDNQMTVVNGGNPQGDQEGWAHTLERELANRHATGGSIPNVLPRLSDQELNVTQSQNNTGNMFEKFSNLDIDSAGRGGEYTVQAGFGWTNGVLLWVASNYGNVLESPNCPDLLASAQAEGGVGSDTGSSGSGSGSGGNDGGSGDGNDDNGAALSSRKMGLWGTVVLAVVVGLFA
ncbi:glycoside hydrolase [Dendrothele bispora CBS 962.96]|uniref:Trehalase n=1 Tax=Dendrothele bispora (strain CBS 962.96) TaxID=1314807 RepID=A0A4S8MBL3_DENBC|nr:glycoside hydrolase [Dendrothele bispora CBS 962.96]